MTLGRPREPQVKREEKECPTHGVTTHAQYVGTGGQVHPFVCMACRCDEAKKRRAAVAAGEATVTHRKPAEPAPAVCPVCWVALPKTGVCDCTE